MVEKDRQILNWVNRITRLTIHHDFNIEVILSHSPVPSEAEDTFLIMDKLVELGYAEMVNPFDGIITEHFRQVHMAGGHYQYEEIQAEKKKEVIKYTAELENLQTANKLNKWLLKTKWLPHILSGLAVLLSILALIYCSNSQFRPT